MKDPEGKSTASSSVRSPSVSSPLFTMPPTCSTLGDSRGSIVRRRNADVSPNAFNAFTEAKYQQPPSTPVKTQREHVDFGIICPVLWVEGHRHARLEQYFLLHENVENPIQGKI